MTFWPADFCKFQKIHRENTGLGISFKKFSTFFHNSSGWPFKIIWYDFLLDDLQFQCRSSKNILLEWSTVSIYLYIRTCFWVVEIFLNVHNVKIYIEMKIFDSIWTSLAFSSNLKPFFISEVNRIWKFVLQAKLFNQKDSFWSQLG